MVGGDFGSEESYCKAGAKVWEQVRDGLGQCRSPRNGPGRTGRDVKGEEMEGSSAARTRPGFGAWLTGKLMLSATRGGDTRGKLCCGGRY